MFSPEYFVVLLGVMLVLAVRGGLTEIRYSSLFFFLSLFYVFLGGIFYDWGSKPEIAFYYTLYSLVLVALHVNFDKAVEVNFDISFSTRIDEKSLIFILVALYVSVVAYKISSYGLLSSSNLEVARLELLNSKFIFYSFLVIFPYLLIMIAHELGVRSWLFFFLLLCFVTILSGFRSPILNFVVVSLVYFYMRYPANRKRMVVFGLVAILIAISLVLYLTQARSDVPIDEAISVLFERLFIINLHNIVGIIDYHNSHGFLYGKTIFTDIWPLLARVLEIFGAERGGTYAEYITAELNPLDDYGFVMTPTFYGIAYADIPWLGLIFHLMFLIIYFSLVRIFLRYPPLVIMMIYYGSISATRGFFSTLVIFIVPLILFNFLLCFLKKIYNGRVCV